MAGNLAAFSDTRVLLDLNEGADPCLVPDLAAVEIDELRKPYVLPQLHIAGNAVIGAHR